VYESYKEEDMPKAKSELDAMTKEDLVAYADDLDVETHSSWLKDEIVSAILKGQRAAARQGAPKQAASKEAQVGEEAEPEAEAEVKPVKVTKPINIKGRDYAAGEEVMLTEEESAHLTEIGAPIEGVEEKTPEEHQTAHDEAREALETEVAYRAKAEAEQVARDEAYEEGEEFDEAEWGAEYDRQQKVNDPEYEAPAAKEKTDA
jgi:hypothetical protein